MAARPPRRSSWQSNGNNEAPSRSWRSSSPGCGATDRRDVCREHDVAEALYYSWRDKILEGGKAALAGKDERQAEKELRKKIGDLERALGRKTYELEMAGEALRGRE